MELNIKSNKHGLPEIQNLLISQPQDFVSHHSQPRQAQNHIHSLEKFTANDGCPEKFYLILYDDQKIFKT